MTKLEELKKACGEAYEKAKKGGDNEQKVQMVGSQQKDW
jgi:hypothetical protein